VRVVSVQESLCRSRGVRALVGHRDAHMKETGHTAVSSAEPSQKPRKRRGMTNFNNSKQKRRAARDLKKKDTPSIEGRETPSNLSEGVEEDQGGTWRGRCKIRSLHLESIAEVEDAGKIHGTSAATPMAESEQEKESSSRASDSSNMDSPEQTSDPPADDVSVFLGGLSFC
jgi:hypothetical protein